MVEVKVFQGGSVATKDVDAGAFGAKVLGRTLKDAVVMYEANQRQGTVKAKTQELNHRTFTTAHRMFIQGLGRSAMHANVLHTPSHYIHKKFHQTDGFLYALNTPLQNMLLI